MRSHWKFALPPTLAGGDAYAAQVRSALSTVGCDDVKVALTYGLLLDEVIAGTVDAAWMPPLLCARVEQRGGRVILRAIRGGTSTYRSVLFARADRGLTLQKLKGTTAAWLDQRSMSGYVLPRAQLRASGVIPEQTFAREKFLGSYLACVRAVLDGKVDVSATFASAAAAATARLGYVEMLPERANELEPLAFSMECPHDGIVVGPRLSPEEAAEFAARFKRMLTDPAPAKVLYGALQVEGFDAPAAPGYGEAMKELLQETNGAAA
ncbi:MAG: PhnD/SsuA/transferrin family substrate-binding protein [Deltaproteobacteria bacterium]|nr:PhnD/SsuA/transferrin family substrate-binding protein [Deltaproteobacteria bacterium]